MTQSDSGSILFPSVTVCKDQMFTKYEDLFPTLQSGSVAVEEAGLWFKERTLSRSRLVQALTIKTVEGSNTFPCTTVSGPRAGEACSFPVR